MAHLTSQSNQIFRGAYSHCHYDTLTKSFQEYAKESFKVYKNPQDQSLVYEVSLKYTLAGYQSFHTQVIYQLEKTYSPKKVYIERLMGQKQSLELFEHYPLRQKVYYRFSSNNQEMDYELKAPNSFHIMAPTMTTSAFFSKAKNFKIELMPQTINTISSKNLWNYQQDPVVKSFQIELIDSSPIYLKINRNQHQVYHFRTLSNPINEIKKLRTDQAIDSKKQSQHIDLYLSQHLSLPFMMKSSNGVEIKIESFENIT